MAKPKYQEPEKLKSHPLFDVRVVLTFHMIWKGLTGSIVTVYNDGSVMVLLDNNVHARSQPSEYDLCLWAHRNIPVEAKKR